MVQKKMAKTCNKLAVIQPNNTLKIEKKQDIAKPSLQNHDGKGKVADLKAVKMKKSRSIKRCDVDISLQSSQLPQTPSPKKGLQCKSPYTTTTTSPNYMKSTSSSEARKERICKLSSKKFDKGDKTVNKACSSMKKMRSLIKAPSFKHTRSGSCKKMAVLCGSDLDVQKATCSSTLKDSKFPSYLELEPGATEAEGHSVFKVCPYNYCSLNGHHHVPAPPLKRFLSSKRRVLKTLKVRPDVVSSPRKVEPVECNVDSEGGGGGEVKDFFIDVYALDREVSAQVSESLLDGPCSETDSEDSLDQTEGSRLSGMNMSPESKEYASTVIQKQVSFESLADSLDGYFGENSDMEWEDQGQSPASHDNCEIYVQADYSKDQDKAGFEFKNRYLELSAADQDEAEFELNNGVSGFAEFRIEGYSAYYHDEIVECLHFSDTDSMPEDKSTETGNKHIEELLMVKDDMSSERDDEIKEDSNLVDEEMVQPTVDLLLISSSDETFCTANDGDQAEIDHSGSGNGADYCVTRRTETSEEEPNKVQLTSDEEINNAEVLKSGRKDHKKTGLDSNNRESGSDLKLVDSSSKLKSVSRCRKVEEDFREDRGFNPRGPNFLAAEPDPDAEKVDLRHQEMDDRRNAEEWMLDYALQKTVNHLAPARNRKVALLVEAFESVLPMPKFESHRSRTSAGFAHSRTIQACS